MKELPPDLAARIHTASHQKWPQLPLHWNYISRLPVFEVIDGRQLCIIHALAAKALASGWTYDGLSPDSKAHRFLAPPMESPQKVSLR